MSDPTDIKMSDAIHEHDQLRARLKDSIRRVDAFIENFGGSRELSLTKTKLEEALMWLKR